MPTQYNSNAPGRVPPSSATAPVTRCVENVSAGHESNNGVPGKLRQQGKSQVIADGKNRAYRTPSTLTYWQRTEALRILRSGSSFHQTAAELSCREIVIAELAYRDLETRMRDLAAKFMYKQAA